MEPAGAGDIDGKAGGQARRERASQTPYKTGVVAAALWAARTRRTATRLQLPVACRGVHPQYLGANTEDIFHHYGGRLHELVPFRLDLCRKGLVQ
jgi:hypothetical protein